MGRYCIACFHPERAAIDSALLEHRAGYARLAARFGLSYGGIRRHERDHLAHAFRDAQELHAMVNTETLVAKLEDLEGAVRRVLQRGESGGDDRLVLLAVREGRANIETLARLGALSDVEARLVALEQANAGESGEHGEHGEQRDGGYAHPYGD